MLENMFVIMGIGVYLLFIGLMMNINGKGYEAMFMTVLYKLIPILSGLYLILYSLITMGAI